MLLPLLTTLLVGPSLCTGYRVVSISPALHQEQNAPQNLDGHEFVPPQFTIQEGLSGVGYANFSDETAVNGWAYLEIDMRRGHVSDIVSAYYAGALEGFVSRDIIYNR